MGITYRHNLHIETVSLHLQNVRPGACQREIKLNAIALVRRLPLLFFACCADQAQTVLVEKPNKKPRSYFTHFALSAVCCGALLSQSVAAAQPVSTISDQDARTALALIGSKDPSGTIRNLVIASIEQVDAARTEAERVAILDRAGDIARGLKHASTPAEIVAVVSSPSARSLGLLRTVSSWDSYTQRFISVQESTGIIATSIRGMPASVQDATAALVAPARTLADTAARDVLSAVSELPTTSLTVDAVAVAIGGESGAKNVKNVFELVQGLRAGDTSTYYAASAIISTKMSDLLGARLAQTRAALGTDINALRIPSLKDLQADAHGVEALAGGAAVISALAAATGNKKLAGDVANVVKTVNTGVQIYQSLGAIAAIASGGTFIAAMGMISAFGGGGMGGGGDAQSQAAIAQLTDLVRQEFKVVNAKLDRIQNTLDEIHVQLEHSIELDTRILDEVRQTNEAVQGLYGRIDRLERVLIDNDTKLHMTRCRPFIEISSSPAPTPVEFQQCAYLFAAVAGISGTPRSTIGPSPTDEELIAAFPPQISAYPGAAWSAAGMIASISSELLSHPRARSYTPSVLNEPSAAAIDIASAANATSGTAAYLALWDRYGGQRQAADRAEFATKNGLDGLIQRLERVDQFLVDVGSTPESIPADIAAFLELYSTAIKKQAPLLAKAQNDSIDEILNEDGKNWSSYRPEGEGDFRFEFGSQWRPVSWTLMEKAGIPLQFRDEDSPRNVGGRFAYRNDSVNHLPTLSARLEILTGPKTNFNSPTSTNRYRVVVKVNGQVLRDHVAEVVSPRYGPVQAPPANVGWFAQDAAQAIAGALNACRADIDCLAKYDRLRRERYSTTSSNWAKLRVIAGLRKATAWSQPSVRLSPLRPAEAASAMLRGYSVIALADAFATHDLFRSALEGNDAVRLVDTDAATAYFDCAARIFSEAKPHDATQVLREDQLSSLSSRYCASLALSDHESANVLEAFDVPRWALARASRLGQTIVRTDWSAANKRGASLTTLQALRLRDFIASGSLATANLQSQ